MRPNLLIKVPEWWRQETRAWLQEQGVTWVECGRRIAEALGRPSPYNHSTIWRYLDGQIHSIEITEGLARVRGVPSPLFYAESAALARWCEAGKILHETQPAFFEALLAQAEALLRVKSDE